MPGRPRWTLGPPRHDFQDFFVRTASLPVPPAAELDFYFFWATVGSNLRSQEKDGCVVKSNVMECRVRLCASPERLRFFLDHADGVISSTISQRVEWSRDVDGGDSMLLRRQWESANTSEPVTSPTVSDVSWVFTDRSGHLTAARLESLSRDILSNLDNPRRSGTEETVPWILTLVSNPDAAARRALAARHQMRDLASPMLSSLV